MQTNTLSDRVIIVGVDPGMMTGFVVLDMESWHVQACELPPIAATDYLERLSFMNNHGTRIIFSIERFAFQANSSKMTRQYDAIEITGVLRFLSRKSGCRLQVINASDAQHSAKRPELRSLGLWQVARDHSNKAACQVAYSVQQLFPEVYLSKVDASQ